MIERVSPRAVRWVGIIAALGAVVFILTPWVIEPKSGKTLPVSATDPTPEYEQFLTALSSTLDRNCAAGRDLILSDNDVALLDLLSRGHLPPCRIVRPTIATPLPADRLANAAWIEETIGADLVPVPRTLRSATGGGNGPGKEMTDDKGVVLSGLEPMAVTGLGPAQRVVCSRQQKFTSSAGHFGFGVYECAVE